MIDVVILLLVLLGCALVVMIVLSIAQHLRRRREEARQARSRAKEVAGRTSLFPDDALLTEEARTVATHLAQRPGNPPRASEGPDPLQVTAQRLMRTFEKRNEAFREQNWPQAELVCEEEVRLGRHLMSISPTPDYAYSLGISLWYQGRALLAMGASPEAEDPLQEAVDLLRKFGRFDVNSSDPDLIDALMMLAEVYSGAQFYVDFERAPLMTVSAMKDYRRARLANGTWAEALITGVSDGWREKAERPLQESIAWGRREVARSGHKEWEAKLASALYVLGASFITLDRHSEAAAYLLEAESMYVGLVRYDPDYYPQWLSLTRQRLQEVAATSDDQSERRHALEAMLPQLRREAYATEEELEHGVSPSKSAARDRLRDALKGLADLYKASGQDAKATELWDGDLGILFTEALKVSWD